MMTGVIAVIRRRNGRLLHLGGTLAGIADDDNVGWWLRRRLGRHRLLRRRRRIGGKGRWLSGRSTSTLCAAIGKGGGLLIGRSTGSIWSSNTSSYRLHSTSRPKEGATSSTKRRAIIRRRGGAISRTLTPHGNVLVVGVVVVTVVTVVVVVVVRVTMNSSTSHAPII